MRTLPLTAAILFYSFVSALCAPPQAGVERTWTGINGKTFLGVFARTFEEGGKKAQFLTSAGKTVTVAFDNLSEKDRELILVFEGKAPAKPAANADTGDSFKELPVADRSRMPTLKPENFGGTDDESMVDALWVSLLWWDSAGIVPIQKTGDFDRKAEWLHKELSRNIAKGGRSAASLKDASEGVHEYFEKRLEEIGTCKRQILHSVDPVSLSQVATGNGIVVLQLTMDYSNGRSFSVASALQSMEADGTFEMHIFGARFAGKMIGGAEKPPGARAGKSYELTLNDREKMPDHYKTQGARFFLNNDGWDGALVLTPYVYKEPGKKAPIPGSTSE